MPGMSTLAECLVSVLLIVGTLGFVLFCLLGFGRGAWLFVRTAWPLARGRAVPRGFEVLPAGGQRSPGLAGGDGRPPPLRKLPLPNTARPSNES
jgi:hypothetical protein